MVPEKREILFCCYGKSPHEISKWFMDAYQFSLSLEEYA
jgi:hypothetical protein